MNITGRYCLKDNPHRQTNELPFCHDSFAGRVAFCSSIFGKVSNFDLAEEVLGGAVT